MARVAVAALLSASCAATMPLMPSQSVSVLKQRMRREGGRGGPGGLGGGVLIAPSILSADFSEMGRECEAVLAGGADVLHLDVMDGHFVPNLTMGPAMCLAVRRRFPEVCLDVHLMVDEPGKFVRAFAEAGASNLTFHIEAVDDPPRLAKEIHSAGMTAGLAINPPTAVERVLPFVAAMDVILIMSVNPGFSGQAFIASVLDKARRVKPMLRDDQRVEVDGGVNPQTAPACREAGCDVLVSASAIFGAKGGRGEYPRIIAELRGDAKEIAPRRTRRSRSTAREDR